MEERIIETLRKNLNIKFLEIKNNSYLHKGHLGDNGSTETHFAVKIAAEELENLTTVNAHRKINKLLKSEFERGLHALEILIKK